MTIDQRQLRYFIEVATVGSINKAAERLHIAQPALSRRMHQLEHELGVSLMVRRPSGVTLTPAGRKLLGRAAAIVDELQRLRDGIDDAPEDTFRHIQIGMVPVINMNEASIMLTMWNSENAIGSTPSRSKWFTWSNVIVATASSYSECMARMRRRSESRTSGLDGSAVM